MNSTLNYIVIDLKFQFLLSYVALVLTDSSTRQMATPSSLTKAIADEPGMIVTRIILSIL